MVNTYVQKKMKAIRATAARTDRVITTASQGAENERKDKDNRTLHNIMFYYHYFKIDSLDSIFMSYSCH